MTLTRQADGQTNGRADRQVNRQKIREISRAEALFLSELQPSMILSKGDIEAAIRGSLRRFGGVNGCAAAMAAEYGEHPEAAADRMRWALTQVAAE